MPIVYGELRKIADAYLRRERGSHTLQPTMDEVGPSGTAEILSSKQFLTLAAQVMRRILVDHARAVEADKRGGATVRTPLHDSIALFQDHTAEFLALDETLTQLARVSARQARVIELRYLAGLNVEEIAEMLSVSAATVSRDQKTAEAWLGHAMSDPM
jgi:RNA polymerase sigma-70 factor (ECF subfamily)